MRAASLDLPVWDVSGLKNGRSLTIFEEEDGHIQEGILGDPASAWLPITGGVPCFIRSELRPDFSEFEARHRLSSGGVETNSKADNGHANTVNTFSDKWQRFTNYGLEASHQEFLFDWYCKKLSLPDRKALENFYQGKDCILEVGPGSGFNTRFMAEHCGGQVFAADISEAAHTTFANTKDLPNCHVIQADLMALPFHDESFDFIMADGVLHHTPDTRAGVEALYRKLRPEGQFFFYVYKKMGPARQFCDRYINEAYSKLDPEDCYQSCQGITELGRELSRLNAKVKLEIGVPILGIPAGEHDVQRLLYYNFMKCFWNEAFDFETNNMVNYDWYHPHFAWQHTEEEVRGWLEELGVKEYSFHPANPNGLSVLLRKPA